jgi:DNA mismatch repair ATPase MutS
MLDRLLEGSFVPNDAALHADRHRCCIITGPNMARRPAL